MSDIARCANLLSQGQTRWSAPLPYPPPSSSFLHAVAASLLGGDFTVEAAVARLTHTLGRSWPWLRPLARRYLKAFASRTRPRHQDVVRFLRHDAKLLRAWQRHHRRLAIVHWVTEPQQMRPVSGITGWHIPAITSPQALADWLLADPSELLWYADLKGLERNSAQPRLRHYHYHLALKPSGGLRLLEAPKVRLKQLQRRILRGILEQVPAHTAVHGFVPGRSIRSFTAPHAAQPVVLRMDLSDFFPSIRAARVQALFRTIGYPEFVASLLTGLSTNITPRDILKPLVGTPLLHPAGDLYSRPHLPQGAPASPTLANLCAYRLDGRLTGLAQSIGATYTRYADDLAFSGGTLHGHALRFATSVAAIARDEGFRVNHRKTRLMRQAVRQHLAGLVINHHPNIRRADYDQLKAILTNSIRHGPDSQNRKSHPRFRQHLEGRIEFVRSISPLKASRLRELFARIEWPDQ